MSAFKEQYSREIQNQEIKSNKRTLKGFMWLFGLLLVIWMLTMAGLFVVDAHIITMALIITAGICVPIAIIGIRNKLEARWIKYYFLISICAASGIVAALLSFHAVFIYVLPLLFAIQYRDKKILWFTYTLDIVVMAASMIYGFYNGLCDLNIILASNHTRDWYLENSVNGYLTMQVYENPVANMLIYGELPRAGILLVFTVMLRYTIMSCHDDEVRIAELTYRKDTDGLTGLASKEKYNELVQHHYPLVKQVSVIFWDVNNLKRINDEYGHDAGNQAVQALAAAMYGMMTDRIKAFRYGGDEFIMVIENPDTSEAQTIIEDVRKELEKACDRFEVTAATGCATGKGSEIDKLVKMADTLMYNNKRQNKGETNINA